jgi:hypothetical protein
MFISLHTLIEIEDARVLPENEVFLNTFKLEIFFQDGMISHFLDFLEVAYLLWICFFFEKIKMARVKLCRIKNFDLLPIHQSK